MKTVQKEYNYLRNGRKVVIRRQYKVNGMRNLKNEELDEYFKNNIEHIQNSKLNDVLDEYNDSHENQISYSLLYQKYKTLFGYRKNHINKSEDLKILSNREIRKKIKKEYDDEEQRQKEDIERLRDKVLRRKQKEEPKEEKNESDEEEKTESEEEQQAEE